MRPSCLYDGNSYIGNMKSLYLDELVRETPPQKRKGHSVDCPCRHWECWSLPSTSPVTGRAVFLPTFPFQCLDRWSFPWPRLSSYTGDWLCAWVAVVESVRWICNCSGWNLILWLLMIVCPYKGSTTAACRTDSSKWFTCNSTPPVT